MFLTQAFLEIYDVSWFKILANTALKTVIKDVSDVNDLRSRQLNQNRDTEQKTLILVSSKVNQRLTRIEETN